MSEEAEVIVLPDVMRCPYDCHGTSGGHLNQNGTVRSTHYFVDAGISSVLRTVHKLHLAGLTDADSLPFALERVHHD